MVNSANQTAQTPFHQYGGEFVAPVNAQQSAGIANTNAAANEAQPYFGAATGTLNSAQSGTTGVNQAAEGLTAASAGPVNAQQIGADQINAFENPYLSSVLGSTSALLNQNNQQQQNGALGTAISSGAFGGDRTGLAAANLEQQQNLSNANVYSGIASNAFNTALGAAQNQQGVNLGAAQANRTALSNAGAQLAGIGSTAYGEGANTASELGSLGAGAQTAGLQGAQAQVGAGTVEQQTQQAQDTALYNQFLQQQSYPFQVGSWLAGISEGTGALSGSTTTTQQPGGFFSDRRLKYDLKKIGKTYDGQAIYSYKMHGDPRTHIGLIAQNVEKKHPHAVGLAAGFKTVDYGKATDKAAKRGHFAVGGAPACGLGTAAMAPETMHVGLGRRFASGGSPDYSGPYGDWSGIVADQGAMYQPNQSRNRNIPSQPAQQHQLAVASGSPTPPPSGSSKVQQSIGLGKDAYSVYKRMNRPSAPNTAPPTGPSPSVPDSLSPSAPPNPNYLPDYSGTPPPDGISPGGDLAPSAAPDAAPAVAPDAAPGLAPAASGV